MSRNLIFALTFLRQEMTNGFLGPQCSAKPLLLSPFPVNWPLMVIHFLIRGRVQGVGFRWFVQREAGELELNGWVRNTEEGDVEVVAAGSPEDLSELRTSLQRGPRGARVDQVIEHRLDESEARNLTAFRIEGAW
jgi:acylphosphatase